MLGNERVVGPFSRRSKCERKEKEGRGGREIDRWTLGRCVYGVCKGKLLKTIGGRQRGQCPFVRQLF